MMTNLFLLAQQNSGNGGGGMFLGFGVVFFIFALIIGIATTLFWLWMLVDCLTSSLPSMEKLIWALVIIFTHIIGALLYFAIARGGKVST